MQKVTIKKKKLKFSSLGENNCKITPDKGVVSSIYEEFLVLEIKRQMNK